MHPAGQHTLLTLTDLSVPHQKLKEKHCRLLWHQHSFYKYSPPAEAAPDADLLVPRPTSGKATFGLSPGAVPPEKPAGDLTLSAVLPTESNCNIFWELGDGEEVGVFWGLPLSEKLTVKQKAKGVNNSPNSFHKIKE